MLMHLFFLRFFSAFSFAPARWIQGATSSTTDTEAGEADTHDDFKPRYKKEDEIPSIHQLIEEVSNPYTHGHLEKSACFERASPMVEGLHATCLVANAEPVFGFITHQGILAPCNPQDGSQMPQSTR